VIAGGVREVATPHLLKEVSMVDVSISTFNMDIVSKLPVQAVKAVAISCTFASVMLLAYVVQVACLEAQVSAS